MAWGMGLCASFGVSRGRIFGEKRYSLDNLINIHWLHKAMVESCRFVLVIGIKR